MRSPACSSARSASGDAGTLLELPQALHGDRPFVVPDSARIASHAVDVARQRGAARRPTPPRTAPLRARSSSTSRCGFQRDALDRGAERPRRAGRARPSSPRPPDSRARRRQLRHRHARDRLALACAQSRTRRPAGPISSACRAAAGRRSRRCGCRGAPRRAARTPRRSRSNVSKSVASPTAAAIAGLNECTNGCMSVVEMSCFSYQVAAGSTTSEYSAGAVIRKSIVVTRSSLPRAPRRARRPPSGAAPAATPRRGPRPRTPSRWRRKYSWPLPDEPSRFARHSVSTRGKFPGASGSSYANRSRAGPAARDDVVGGRPPGRARPRRDDRAGCGRSPGTIGVQPSRADQREAVSEMHVRRSSPRAERRGELPGARTARSATGRCAGTSTASPAMLPRRARPVEGERERRPAGDRPHLLLADVVRPAAAVHALAAAEHDQGEDRTVDLVGVVPVVRAGAHHDHRAALGTARRSGRTRAPPGAAAAVDAGDRLLPRRRVGLRRRRSRPATRPGSPSRRTPYCASSRSKTVVTSRPPTRIAGYAAADRSSPLLGRRRRRSAAGRPRRARPARS